MFLKSLEMQGFKSFPDKTVIHFNKGLTAVVGPNGSGKSNLSDAMRWVLGEQSTKTLRGEKMEDVIFLGTSSRKPQGFAAVSLTFDNSDRALPVDADEVTITRRYYRSGESEYAINSSAVRLRDINELFMDTGLGRDGYSMIGQGKIAEIISAKSGERREIFEEAAGISKYRYRKAEAERKLLGAQENLTRLYDILSELEGRVEPLRIQSEKAKEFLTLSERKKALEVSLWLLTLEKYQNALREQEQKYLIARGEDEHLSREIEKIEEQIQETYKRMQACLTQNEECQTIRQNLLNRTGDLKSEVAVRENDIRHNEETKARLSAELSAQEESAARREEEAAAKEEQKKELSTAGEEIQKEAEGKRQELLSLSAEQDDFSGKLEEANSRVNRIALESSRQNLLILTKENAAADEENRIRGIEGELSSLTTQAGSDGETIEQLEGLLKEIADKKASLENARKGYDLKLSGRKQKLQELSGEQQKLDLSIKEKLQRARLLLDLEQNMEGFNYSVKAVIRAAKNGAIRGVLGTVTQLLSVKPEYSVAVETALGGALQNIVVEDEAAAKAGIRLLSEQKAGRATFLPLTSVKGNPLNEPGLERYAGFVAVASELVEADPKYDGVVRFLLGRIAVVEDLDTAITISRKYGYKFRIVTLDGQQVNVGGSFTGGSAAKNAGVLSRKNEASALQAEAEKLKGQKAQLDQRAAELSREAANLSAQVEGIRAEQITANEDQIRFEADLLRHRQNRQQLSARKAELERQKAQCSQKIAAARKEAEEARTALAALEKEAEAAKNALFEFQGSRDSLSGRREELAEEISALTRQEIENRKDLENLTRQIEELRADANDRAGAKARLLAERDAVEGKTKQLETAIASLQKESGEAAARIVEYEEKSRKLLAKRQELEGETTRLRQQEREVSARKEQAAGELARLDEQKLSAQRDYDQIILRLQDEYQLTRSEAQQTAIPIEDRNEAQKELASLKNRIRGLGSVNVGAIEEYKEVSERYEFLKAQVEDAANAKSELEKLIKNLTSDMERLFRESFAAINKNFGEIFTELFGGGKASLTLSDPEDVLNCGIDINVQPPGKIIKSLSALSGGEQSFIAIAIYFAILKVRPAPFCVLDEIEAALDDVNVVKYAEYLRKMSGSTQFILITHRRGTMEEADVLYGVTMQERGVSKLLELKVTEIASKMGELESQG